MSSTSRDAGWSGGVLRRWRPRSRAPDFRITIERPSESSTSATIRVLGLVRATCARRTERGDLASECSSPSVTLKDGKIERVAASATRRGPRSRGAVGARRSRRLLSLRDTARAMSQENVEIVREGIEAWNQHDADLWLSNAAPDVEWMPAGPAAVERTVYRAMTRWPAVSLRYGRPGRCSPRGSPCPGSWRFGSLARSRQAARKRQPD